MAGQTSEAHFAALLEMPSATSGIREMAECASLFRPTVLRFACNDGCARASGGKKKPRGLTRGFLCC
jgi:hypothetical protein